MVVNDDEAVDEPMRRYLPLFTTQAFAENALRHWETVSLDRPQQVSAFVPRELPRFIAQLEEAATMTDLIGFDQGAPGTAADDRPARVP